ncbi:four helix bundle protein [Oscillatoria sp. FACHB-1407]|uniref:four helix bundle protein n=1 Tax=Oscillatoria sp. FACHB-1407 TaxID=2692847 RepID=UPI0016897A47|nr:four helix bundle protein [Oscillatoria sp. FACHB-1407]MBD2465551.1 four helix bundle protein [Oscillatoria sp. FACHB-1407]
MGKLESYRDLEVWKISMQLAREVYQITEGMPKHEIYGLTSQIRRASVSVPANIAEGYGRNHRKEYVQFLGVANGSLKELETLLLLAHDLNYLNDITKLMSLCESAGRLLTRLRQSLQRVMDSH